MFDHLLLSLRMHPFGETVELRRRYFAAESKRRGELALPLPFHRVALLVVGLRVGCADPIITQDSIRADDPDSEAPVPLTDLLAMTLRDWQKETVYGRPSDWVFASTRCKGKKPRSASVLAFDHLRPAALAAGVKIKPGQRFGFHNFRHGLASWLVNKGTDVKTVQSLLRHSNVKTTLGLYTHRVNESMLMAQDSVMRAMTACETVQ